MLFGLAECRRGETCSDFIKNGDMVSFGQLMYISHDGDRIVKHDSKGNATPWTSPDSDDYFNGLIEGFKSGNSQSKLYLQAGGYGCSCEELDNLVDIASQTPGVLGAGLTGAGMGGCVLVLVKEDATEALLANLKKSYYDTRGLPMGAEVCVPNYGAQFLSLNC